MHDYKILDLAAAMRGEEQWVSPEPVAGAQIEKKMGRSTIPMKKAKKEQATRE